METFRELCRSESVQCDLTCSIGIACSPEDGKSFNQLFQHSDMALYYAKAAGKDVFAQYDSERMAWPFEWDHTHRVANTAIDSNCAAAEV